MYFAPAKKPWGWEKPRDKGTGSFRWKKLRILVGKLLGKF